jgi:GH15 family glucan-1,4-alpha-glucosidase
MNVIAVATSLTECALQRELADGPFVRRYIAEETDDGFSESEGAFFILSFWLVGALLAIDQRPEAEGLFDQLIAKANHLGLFAKMWDPAGGRALGNFPKPSPTSASSTP